RHAQRLVVAALALRRNRQAAGAGTAPLAARSRPGHGHAVAGHRRRLVAAADALPAAGRGAHDACKPRTRGGKATAALVKSAASGAAVRGDRSSGTWESRRWQPNDLARLPY